RYLLHCFG
ncbi:ABC-2 type transporter family protein, partial [Vibrio parahaemolyticus V-223/04]